jgi:putative tricarboxylic transport membrane protein
MAATVSAASFKPAAPTEIVVHGGAGSGVDLFARAIASISEKEKLHPQRLAIVNKTGGGGLVAMSYVKEKAGDVNTIAMYTTVWIAAPLTSTAATVTLKDLTPIAGLVREPSVAAVKANSPYKSMKDFIEAAKKSPGQLRQSGGSLTSVDNLTRLLIQKQTGANWVFISFPSGGERLSNLLGEHVQIMFMQPQEAAEHIRGGTLRVIAAITENRLPSFPDVSTLKEQGIDISIPQQVRGAVAPPGVPPEVVAYWDDFFVRLTKTAGWHSYLQENQLEPGHIRGAELGKFFETNTNQVRTLLKEAGAKVVR